MKNLILLVFITTLFSCEKESKKDDFNVEFDSNQHYCLVLNKKDGGYLRTRFDGTAFNIKGSIITFINKSDIKIDTIGTGGVVLQSIVLDYKSDNKYGVVLQKPINKIIDKNVASKKPNEIDELIEKSTTYNYWIISKQNNKIYGPLNFSDYKILKSKLKVSNNLKLTNEN